jgi:predicted enzyme related to lactoylglutathione lyase
MADRKPIPGKLVWFDLVSNDAKRAQAFYGEVLGWKVAEFPMGNATYDMILTGDSLDTMVGGYSPPKRDGRPGRWLGYVSVNDVDATAKLATAAGGKVAEGPFDIPTVGRAALIVDPQGAELYAFKSLDGDKPDAPATQGQFFWHELHTPDPQKALAFYEKVFGFAHRAVDMGPGGTYHILSQGGVDRGGATHHMLPGTSPHWLPYVFVDDPDAALSRARHLGATVPMPPEDIPGVGRFGILQDPTGALIAIMKPQPPQPK